MTLPNFFVIGAQKCGTTALYMALRQHPDIYMSSLKEPRFFAFAGKSPDFCGPGSTLFKQGVIQEQEAYKALFSQANAYQAIGEASPIYLSSYQPTETAQQIHTLLPHARLIVILRQPAERAWSAFLHHRRLGIEPLRDFRQALLQEPQRTAQHWYPGWRYRQNSLYAANLEPYFELFGRRQIRVYLYEEWIQQPAIVLADIFQFLQVDTTFQPSLGERYNVSVVPRIHWLQRLLGQKSAIGAHQLFNWVVSLNQTRPVMPAAIHKQLTRQFGASIQALSRLLERKLVEWNDTGSLLGK